MRVVVVGGGVAGLALATLLPRTGAEVTVLERRRSGAATDGGYALALWPHGTRVLLSLGLRDLLDAHGEPTTRYTARGDDGRVLTSQPLPAAVTDRGLSTMIDRAALVAGLERAARGTARVIHEAVVVGVAERDDAVVVELADGTTTTADVVVGADGIGSAVRTAVHGAVPARDTGWSCVAWWAAAASGDPGGTAPGEVVERWAAGSFLGRYPAGARTCWIAGAPTAVLAGPGQRAALDRVVASAGLPAGLVPGGTDPLPLWRMSDVRAPAWVTARTALVGDAACGFLPTAGVGASMALESAAALADELGRTDTRHVRHALRLYQRRRRRRVEAAQDESRALARVMFLSGPRRAALRDRVIRHVPLWLALRTIVRSLDEPI